MKRTISLVLVLTLPLIAEVANADFTFGTPTNLGPTVNSSSNDADACVSTDGLELYLSSRRPGGFGSWDIWVSKRDTTSNPWTEPVNLGPLINSPNGDGDASISTDGLSLFFKSDRPGGTGGLDLYVTMRATRDDSWAIPVNLGPTVNGSTDDSDPVISADGLSLFFTSDRPGGAGSFDIWVTTRTASDDEWSLPVNLGSPINNSSWQGKASISCDGLVLVFEDRGPGTLGISDLWLTMRATTGDSWGTPVNLGPNVNSQYAELDPSLSMDGRTMHFGCIGNRPGGFGGYDLWQSPIELVVDLNGDGIVDSADMCIMVDHWGEDYSLSDIGPMPWGDGIVDVQDLIVLAEHLFEGIPPVEVEEVNVDEDDADSQVELEQGQILVVTLKSNPTTGYRWEVVETQESILQQMGEAEFKQSETGEPPLVGAGGLEIFRFKAISAGQTSLKLVYHRPWEEGVEPVKTFSIQVVVH